LEEEINMAEIQPEKVYLTDIGGRLIISRLKKRNDQLLLIKPCHGTFEAQPNQPGVALMIFPFVAKPDEVPINEDKIYWKYPTDDKQIVSRYMEATSTIQLADLSALGGLQTGGRQ
jgi:hypothetical protein